MFILTLTTAIAAVTVTPFLAVQLTQGCSGADIITSCTFDENTLDLGSNTSTPERASPNVDTAVGTPVVLPDRKAARACDDVLVRCDLIINVPTDRAEPAPASGPITISDLASFTPGVGELVVQPEHWGVLGIPTNFVATATDHVQAGTLLGQPVQVRWRPVAYTFDYGDGTVATAHGPGALWRGVDDDWTETSTSHVYDERGPYTASVTVTFEADIAAPTGWSPVPGTLDRTAPAETVRIFEVQTVLTGGDCIDLPDGPGCAP